MLPGFAQLKVAAREGSAEAWSGLFFPGGSTRGLPGPGTPAELLLPNHLVGRTTVGPTTDGALALAGETPWPTWAELFASERDPEVPTMVSRDGYFEARGPSVISVDNWVTVDQLPFERGQRLLLDYRAVNAITVPFEWFLGAAEGMEALGLKVAVVAASPLAFGISRQAIQTAALDEDRSFRVFRDYEEARLWLLA